MAAVGVPFHAITTTAAAAAASSMDCEFPAQSHGSSSSASSTLLDDIPAFDLSDFIMSDQAPDFPPSSGFPAVVAHEYQSPMAPPPMNMIDEGGRGDCFGDFCNDGDINSTISRRSDAELGGRRRDGASRIAFRMKSQVEILDDGFKWRKYGKKSVKNSPNPRNYYRCSTEGCSVKKRVERDREDPGYVITMYEGIHNHMSPGVVYYASRDAVSGRYFVAGCQMPSAAAAAATASSPSS